MIINFDKIEEKSIEGFKGGKGTFLTRMTDDGNVKIMRNVLKPGSSIGRPSGVRDAMASVKYPLTIRSSSD